MKRTIYYMILCLLMSLGEIMAQGISGKVMDGKEQPVDGVAVILQTLDSVYVDAVVTDTLGDFRLNHPLDQSYRLIFQHLLYNMVEKEITTANVGTVVLEEKDYQLAEITVKGERPQVKLEGGKLTYDVPQLMKDKTATNAFEIIKDLPGLIERNDNLELVGASRLNIILNGQLTTDAGDNVYPGEKIHLTLTLKNTGSNGYTGLTATLADGTVLASDVELAAGATFEQTVEWAPVQSGAIAAEVVGTSDTGEAVSVASPELNIATQDASQALVLDVTAQAQTTTIYSEPAVVRFAVQVKNIGQTDAATLTVKEAGTTVATIPSLPSGESRTLVFDLETSIAGQIQFEVAGKDAAGNDKAYDSNIIFLTYVEPTPEPTATPAPTAVPPTPTPEPTATPVPTIGDIIAQHVNPVVLYTIAGVLAAVIVALVAVSSVSGAKRKKRMERAIDTIELSPDVRDSFGKRRRRAQNVSAKAGKTPEKEAEQKPDEKPDDGQIVPTPEFEPYEFAASTAAKNAPHKTEEGENHRRRTPQNVPTDKTLRVAPVEERPEFTPQGKVDDSKTRIFGKLDMENAVKEEQKKAEEAPKAETAETAPEAGQETIRLSGEDVQKLKAQVREDHFGVKGKKRDEIKPMKKGLFGFGKKNDDDDFLIDSDDDGDDDDDLFE